MTSQTVRPTRQRRGRSTLAWAAFLVACAVNLYGVYAPSQPGPVMFPGFDKVAHLGSFALIMVTGALAGIRARWLALALLFHAIASELIQHSLLPDRSGDPLDVLADVVGIAIGALVAWAVTRWTPPSARRSGSDPGR